MADEKLTGLTNTPSAADDDQIYIVDVSDTTDDPTGTSKSIEVADLLAGTADASHTHTESDITDLGPYADAVHTHVQADITDLSITAGDIDAEASTDGQVLTSDGAGNAAWETASGGGGGIPEAPNDGKQYGRESEAWTEITGGGEGSTQEIFAKTPVPVSIVSGRIVLDLTDHQDADRIVIEGTVQSDGNAIMYCFLNDETTVSSYHSQRFGASNGAVQTTEYFDPRVANIPDDADDVDYGFFRVSIDSYAIATDGKMVFGEYNQMYSTDRIGMGFYGVAAPTQAAVTKIVLEQEDYPTSSLSGTIRAYKESVVSVGVDGALVATNADMPVVQSCSVENDGTLLWGSEDGWAITKSGAGIYQVTFPTAATHADEQALTGNAKLTTGASASEQIVSFSNITTTSCQVVLSGDDGVEIDRAFSIIRRLPDVSMPVAETTSKFLIQEIELSSAGSFDFTDIPGGYDKITVEGKIADTASNVAVYMYVNGNTTISDYHHQRFGASNANLSTLEASTPEIGRVVNSGHFRDIGDFALSIVGYDDNLYKGCSSTYGIEYADGSVAMGGFYCSLGTSFPITSLSFESETGATLKGKLRLYGEKPPLAQPPAGRYMIQEITDPVSGEFDFTNIPQTYKRLIVKGHVRSAAAASFDNLFINLNAETTASNYHRQHFAYGNGALFSGGEASDCSVAFIAAASATTGAYATVGCVVEGYAGAHKKIITGDYNSEYGTDAAVVGKATVTSDITDAVTTLTFKSDGGEDVAGTLTLYGEM